MTVSKYGKGLWKIDVSDGYDELTGKRKRIRKTGFTSKKQAEEYEAHIKLFELRELKPKQKISIDYLYSLVKIEDEIRGNSQSTKDTQDSYYRVYISKFFAKANMRTLTVLDIKKFREWLQEQPSIKGGKLTNKNINRQMIFLHKLFDISILHQIRSDNPCQLKALPEKHVEMKYYTPEQFKRFLALIDPIDEFRYKLFFEILMFTGARSGEALALTWEVVNLDEGYINIKSSAHYRKKEVTIGATKTTQSVRRIYIHKSFVDELKVWKTKQFKLLEKYVDKPETLQIYQTTPEIVTHPQITGFRHDKLKKRMPDDLPLIRNHDFRHSHAAFLISQGLRKGEGKDYLFFTLMKRLGHSSITTTVNTYSHLFPSQQKEIANAFDDF
ncbi:site-specific integrase [Lactococcus fujiensis]|uniref:Tyrosine recombinase XerC n=1 Tax=Lactococcus fujiensis JCM 16395 TaxID=1291764 RepID=A0A2A5RLP1_9LACT|nr:site-specific integrase [Lactococcus fujiensis]PCS00181.1 tyrosine recombinase XerC [Lactococcus fujiensis JCM 16395]